MVFILKKILKLQIKEVTTPRFRKYYFPHESYVPVFNTTYHPIATILFLIMTQHGAGIGQWV
jgi:hypothetical protein